jgi:hypothetical protein
MEKKEVVKKTLLKLNNDVTNIRKNLILLHNLNNKDQIIKIDGCNRLKLNKRRNHWKNNFLVFLFNAGVPNCWILDISYKLEDFFSMKETNNNIDFGPKKINTVYIKTLNYVTKEHIKNLVQKALNKKKIHLH